MKRHIDLVKPASREQPMVRVLPGPADEPDKRPLSFGLIARLWKLMEPHRGKRNRLLIAVLVRSIQVPLIGWSIGAVINGPISNQAPFSSILIAALGVLALAVFTQLTLVFRQLWALQLGELVIHDLRASVFAHLQSMPMSYYAKNKTGRVISRITSDCDAVRTGVQDVLFVTLVQVGQMVGSAVLMGYYDLPLLAVVFAMSPFVWWIGSVMRQRLSISYRRVQESFSRVTATLAESVSLIRVTQAFAREQTNAAAFRELTVDHAEYNMASAREGGVLMPLLEMTSQLSLALVLLVGGYRALVIDNPMPVGDLIQFWFLASLFFSPIQAIGTQYNQALTAMAGAERVFGLLDQKPEWGDLPGAGELKKPVQGRIEVRNVSFAYEPDRPILQDVSFVADAGQMIALVGETGSGKSTLASLIARYYLPNAGQVLIDGQDIRGITSASLSAAVSVVPQQNFLFSGTVLENILAGKPGATVDDARAALRDLGCERLIHDLPQGLETETGSRGSRVSLGQRQLICFARALVMNPRIMVLDEATSAVDTLTELRIQRALNRLLTGRTSIVIAHRLSTIQAADQILVMAQGQIIERGLHQELLSLGGHYADLHHRFVGANQSPAR
jgi:ATP-binding cassette, subfamily B, bacterial